MAPLRIRRSSDSLLFLILLVGSALIAEIIQH
jgi:hypothetical protein